MSKVSILGVDIDNLDIKEAVAEIEVCVREGEPDLIVTANPEIIMLARQDEEFSRRLERARMITADGIGVVIAARLLGKPVKQRVAGIDLVTALFALGAKKGLTFYFVGARPGVAEKAARKVRSDYPGIQIIGVHHGFFRDDSELLRDIAAQKPDILLAALGMGKQEKWILDRVSEVGVPVSIGVGGSFDVFAGEAKRAPAWMCNTGLEWLYRLLKQPSRPGRMLQLPRFLLLILLSRLKLVK